MISGALYIKNIKEITMEENENEIRNGHNTIRESCRNR